MKTSEHPAVLQFRQQLELTRKGLQRLDAVNERARNTLPPPKLSKGEGKDPDPHEAKALEE